MSDCRFCPPGCKSCVPDDCECYTHQDWPDMAIPSPLDSSELDAIRRAVYVGDSTRSPERDVRTLLREVDRLGRWEALLEDEGAIVAVWQALWQIRPMTTENGRATAVHALRALAREMAAGDPI